MQEFGSHHMVGASPVTALQKVRNPAFGFIGKFGIQATEDARNLPLSVTHVCFLDAGGHVVHQIAHSPFKERDGMRDDMLLTIDRSLRMRCVPQSQVQHRLTDSQCDGRKRTLRRTLPIINHLLIMAASPRE
jgi:hypothetical protein